MSEPEDVRRLRALPLDVEVTGEEYVDQLTRLYARDPDAPTQTLRPLQAAMLVQAIRGDGLVALAGCGSGKTLTSLLLPLVLGAERPLLLLPAAMRAQNASDQRDYAQHWRLIPVEVMSYEGLSSPSQRARLEELAPDLIICDEAHALRNLKSARVRRLESYIRASRAKLCALSGTLVSRSLRDYAHVMNWALRVWSPLPRHNSMIDMFARVIEDGDATRQMSEYVDSSLPPGDTLEGRLHVRLRRSRGVVISSDQRVASSLVIETRKYKQSKRLRSALVRLLADQNVVSATHDALDEETVELMLRSSDLWSPKDAIYSRVWAQLAMGCVYIWDWGDRAPDYQWVEARRGWGSTARRILDVGRYDSEALLKRDLRSGAYRDQRARDALEAWDAVRDREPPMTRAVWVDTSWVEDVVAWARAQKDPPIIWVQLQEVARKLHELTGWAMYGSGSEASAQLDANRHTAHPCIMSIASHGTGKNLQAWRSQIVAHPLSHPARWEQMIARTHRHGQLADSVSVTVYRHGLFGRALNKARRDAQYIVDTTGQEQRLIYADEAR